MKMKKMKKMLLTFPKDRCIIMAYKEEVPVCPVKVSDDTMMSAEGILPSKFR